MFDFLTYLTSLFFNLKITGVQLLGVTFRLPSQLTGVDGDDDVLDYVGDRGVAECQTSFNHVKVCLQFVALLHVPHEFLKLENFSLVRRPAELRSKLCLTQVGAHQGQPFITWRQDWGSALTWTQHVRSGQDLDCNHYCCSAASGSTKEQLITALC